MNTTKEQTEALTRFNVSDATITEMQAFLHLKVAGIDDKEGLEEVHGARMIVKTTRVSIDKTRKELNEEALKWQRTVNGEAKRLVALLAPIEAHLQGEEDAVEAEKEQIKREAREAAKAKHLVRMRALAAVESFMSSMEVEKLDDAAFEEVLAEATLRHGEQLEADRVAKEKADAEEVERKRVAAEEDEKRAKAAKAERARLAKARAKAKADAEVEAKRLREERKELEKEKRELAEEKQRLADEERLRVEADEEERKRVEPVEAVPEPAGAEFYCELCDGTSLGVTCKNPNCPEPVEAVEEPIPHTNIGGYIKVFYRDGMLELVGSVSAINLDHEGVRNLLSFIHLVPELKELEP